MDACNGGIPQSLPDLRAVAEEVANSKALVSQIGSLMVGDLAVVPKQEEGLVCDGALLVERTLESLSNIMFLLQLPLTSPKTEFLEDGLVDSAGRKKRRKKKKGALQMTKRSYEHTWEKVVASLEDGHSWRKYGQKPILGSNFPRSYYRCTHKQSRGCKATRHVQQVDEDPSLYVIVYLGLHTCAGDSGKPRGRANTQVVPFMPSPIDPVADDQRKLDPDPTRIWCEDEMGCVEMIYHEFDYLHEEILFFDRC